jgi:hypothetical protein
MRATIVRSPLALNVAGEEPERGGAPQDRKAGGHPGRASNQVTLAVNLKTAKAFGLTAPQSILAGAEAIK